MAPKSCAVVVSKAVPACDIVKLIVRDGEFLQPKELESGIMAYPWHIDTKYYSADVNVCTLQERIQCSQAFGDTIEAVVLHFDSKKNEGLVDAEEWELYMREFNPEIRILLCNNCDGNPTTGISKLAAQEWCIKRGYELVELNPEKDEEWETDQDFVESTGVERIIQALHAHMWPTLCLKSKGTIPPPSIQPFLLSSSLISAIPQLNVSPSFVESSASDESNSNLGQELSNLKLQDTPQDNRNSSESRTLDDPPDELGSGGSTDDFFELFQNLAGIKEHVSSMGSDDRKACAEKVVRAFWQAMGGDSDELSDQSDDNMR